MSTSLICDLLGAVVFTGAFTLSSLRWLRVLQREHYEAAALRRFWWRWSSPAVGAATARLRSSSRPFTLTHLSLLAVLIGIVLDNHALLLLATAVYGCLCPVGLSLKGRTSRLVWTRRLRTTAATFGVLSAALVALSLAIGAGWWGGLVVVWGNILLLELSTRLLAPYEARQSNVFVQRAKRRLDAVHPLVVGITGSYGKTSTKHHLADLLARDGGVVATPRSFNNRAGLSRAINEGLVDGTRVFIAEMGTYGPGEIADLCSWCAPTLSIITAIGPVHLERMGDLDTIERAKFEITGPASTVIVNVDDARLRHWPARLTGKRVRTAGSVEAADVTVRVVDDAWSISVDGAPVGSIAPLPSVQPTNLACAIAAALELGLHLDDVVARSGQVAPVANRANVVTAPSGVVVIDDTFNANPASAAASVALLQRQDVSGRRVVVTPGLIELGPDQFRENAALAASVRAMGAELVIVQRTNVRALRDGFGGDVRRFDTRDGAVAWVRSSLTAGDAVLYLNDLPDHYP